MDNETLSGLIGLAILIMMLLGVACIVIMLSNKSKYTSVESGGWSVRDLIETIQKEDKPVNFSIQWAEWSVTVTPKEAITLLSRFAPDARIRVSRTAGSLFIRGKAE